MYSNSDFKNQYDFAAEQLNIISEVEQAPFYRIERDYWRSLNDNMLYGFHGISHFDSTRDNFVTARKFRFNYTAINASTYENCGNVLGDSLLSIKYVLGTEKTDRDWRINMGNGIYRNEYALPFVAFFENNPQTENDTEWDYFNKVYSALSGEDIVVAYPPGYQDKTKNLIDGEYYLADKDVLTYTANQINSQNIDYDVNKTKITVNYLAERDGNLFLNIPIDFGWQATVNGNKVNIGVAFEYFVSVPVYAGENTITLKYRPSGTRLGIALSGCGIAMTIATMFIYRKKFFDSKEQHLTR